MSAAMPQISLPKLTLTGANRGFKAILTGIVLGIVGILFHNSYSPFGLMIALLESGIGFFIFGRRIPGRFVHLLLFFSWLAVVYKSASFGVSQEILIEGNINGFIFLLGGMIANFFALAIAKRVK
jgi:hypothetical protein